MRKFGWSWVHFRLTCSRGRNSLFHRAQKTLARYCTCLHCVAWRSFGVNFPGGGGRCEGVCVKIMEGLSISGASGSVDTGASGRLFIMAATSAIKVVSTLWVSCLGGSS